MRILAKSLAASVVFAVVIGSGSSAVAAKAIPKGPAIPVKAIPKGPAIPAKAIPKGPAIPAKAIPKGPAIPAKAIPKGPAIPKTQTARDSQGSGHSLSRHRLHGHTEGP